MVLIQDQRAHLGVADCQLELRHCQLGSLTVHVGTAGHPMDQGRRRGLGRSLRGQRGAARHRRRAGRRSVPLRSPLDGPPLPRDAADPDVRRHLFQDRCPRVAEPAAAPATEGGDEDPHGGIMDKAHSPKNNFQQSGKSEILIEQKPQVTGTDPKETTG